MSHDDDNDSALFREAVGEVKPVGADLAPPWSPKPAPKPRQLIADERRVLQDMLSDEYDPTELQPADTLFFARDGLQRTALRRLRRGEYRIGAELDLHGMTLPDARAALAGFLTEARRHHAQCVRIIHGKGYGSQDRGPVLKGMVNRWLRQRDEVLAFCSARPADGGTGALYVLLRR